MQFIENCEHKKVSNMAAGEHQSLGLLKRVEHSFHRGKMSLQYQ